MYLNVEEKAQSTKRTIAVNSKSKVTVAAAPLTLASISRERQEWEVDSYASSNKKLYAILAKCYRYYHGMTKQDESGKKKRQEIVAFLGQNNIGSNKNTHGLTKILKCVFFDGKASIDRRRISTYSVVLRSALNKNIRPDDLEKFIESNGGVQEIRLSAGKNTARLSSEDIKKMRAHLLDPRNRVVSIKNQIVSKNFGTDDHDKFFVVLAVARSTETFDVVSICKSEKAINTAINWEAKKAAKELAEEAN